MRCTAALFIALLIAAAYGNSLSADFVLDAKLLVGGDTRLREASRENVWMILSRNYWWPTFESDLYRPLTTFSYLLNSLLWGNVTHPQGYHLLNLLLHLANALLVYRLARRYLRYEAVALLVAAIFAVHPLGSEVVTNIAGRSDLLVTLALLAALELHAGRSPAGGWRQYVRRGGLVLAALASVLCKESGVVVIPLMLLDDLARPRPSSGDRGLGRLWGMLRDVDWMDYLAVLPSLLLLVAIRCWITWTTPVFGQIIEDNPIAMAGFFTGRMTAIKVLGYYLALIFWPAQLSCDYSYQQIPLFSWSFSGSDLDGWLALGIVLLLLVVGLRARTRLPSLFFFLALAFVSLLPTANLLMPIGTIMGERLMYLPLAGLLGATAAALLAWGGWFDRWLPGWDRFRQGSIMGLALVVLAALAWRTYGRNQDWSTDEKLWASAVRTCPNSYKVYKGLADAISNRDPENERIDEVLQLIEQGMAIFRRWPLPDGHIPQSLLLDLAANDVRKGNKIAWRAGVPGSTPAESLAYFEKALAVLDQAVTADRAVNQASRQRRQAMGIKPGDIPDVGMYEIYDLAATVNYCLARYDKGLDACRYLCHLQPSRGHSFRLLARLYRANGQWPEAAIANLQSVVLGDNDLTVVADLAEIYQRLAPRSPVIIVADGKPTLNRQNPLAREHLDQACRQLVAILLDAKRPADARQLRAIAVHDFGCAPQIFAGLLPAGD
jgi:tetratricopeptide (TPR) repeat protein